MEAEKILVEEVAWQGIITIRDITESRADPSFYYEYLLTRNIIDISKKWQDQRVSKKMREEFHTFLLGLFRAPLFNKTSMSDEHLLNNIQNRIQPGTAFDNNFRNQMVPQSQMLSYLSEGEWKTKSFAPEDRIYLICYETDGVPLLWMVTSVNAQQNVCRLHVWSKSLLSYFLDHLSVQTIPMYRGFGTFCLSYYLSLLGPSIHRLYYTPYSRNNISAKSTTNVLKTMTGGVDKTRLADEDDPNSLGESLYVDIDDGMRQAYENTNLKESNVNMCIVCETAMGTHYTEKYGKGTRFCGEECLQNFSFANTL